ncbi:MAG: acyl--CoA ligase [Eubacterium sp.]|jgi:long-chain acyl-CoA synthetase|nr:acyl--CoA ligase [Eubacterium sp.]
MAFNTLKGLLEKIKEYGETPAFRLKSGKNTTIDISYSRFYDEASALGAALLKLGLKGKHVAILSGNRYEWIVSYLAIAAGTGVVVPIDRDLPDEAIIYLLKAGDVSAVLYSDAYDELIKNADLPCLEYCICFDGEGDENHKFLFYQKILETGQTILKSCDNYYDEIKISETDTAAILFTSGTTGFLKGVVLTQKNIVSNLKNATCFEPYREREIMFSILPYHHAFECTVGLLASLANRATICINDSLKYLAQNFLLFKPTGMFLVPAVIYAMYKRITDAEKKLGRPLTPEEGKGVFGGRLTRIFSGSAPLNPEMILLLKTYGISLCQGYGLTETSPVVTSFKYDLLDEKNIASVGQAIVGCEVKISDGEIWVKGDNVMAGYYKNPEADSESFEGEWFKTGDLGYIDIDGFVYVNGRKKNVIIASGGENVYPEEIEQFLLGIPMFSDSLVYGGDNGANDTVTAVIFPNYELLEGKSESEISAAVNAEIDALNDKLPIYKQILAVKIRKTPFEKTTSNKIKRNAENIKAI